MVRGEPAPRDGDHHPQPHPVRTSGSYSDAGNSAADSQDHYFPGSRDCCPASYGDVPPPGHPLVYACLRSSKGCCRVSGTQKTLDPNISPSLCKASDQGSAGGSQPISQPKRQHLMPVSPRSGFHHRPSSQHPEASQGPSAFKPHFWLSGP